MVLKNGSYSIELLLTCVSFYHIMLELKEPLQVGPTNANDPYDPGCTEKVGISCPRALPPSQ